MQTEQLKLKVSERTNFQKIQGISAYVFFPKKRIYGPVPCGEHYGGSYCWCRCLHVETSVSGLVDRPNLKAELV